MLTPCTHRWVGNAKQAASYYITRMGFTYLAYRGLETGSRCITAHVVTNGGATFVFASPIRGVAGLNKDDSEKDRRLVQDIHAHLEKHGDAVKDVAFEVDDAKAVYDTAVAKGAVGVQKPTVLRSKADGEIVTAVVTTYGDTAHTLVERSRYRGVFMPGYRDMKTLDPIARFLPSIPLEAIDHCVGNQGWDELEAICK